MHSLPDLKTGIRKIKGKIAILNITSWCNANCIFCSEGNHDNPVNVDIGVIKETIVRLKSQGVREVNFMGGETTMREDLEEILDFINRKGISTYLVTNGIRFSDRQFAKRILPYLGSLEISFHAHNRKLFKELAGRDAFGEVIRGIENIRKFSRKAVIFFNFVPNSLNFSKITETLKVIKGIMGARPFLMHVKSLNVEGRVEDNPGLLCNYGEFGYYLKKAINYAIRNNIGIVISRFPLCIYEGFEYLCLELPLELRENTSFFYNNVMLTDKLEFRTQSLLSISDSYKIPECADCSLKNICPGLDSLYAKYKKDRSYLAPQDKSIASVISDMINRSAFFRMDYLYHHYPLKIRTNAKTGISYFIQLQK